MYNGKKSGLNVGILYCSVWQIFGHIPVSVSPRFVNNFITPSDFIQLPRQWSEGMSTVRENCA
jgi:hypothetical protein